eukprot:1756236-Alexandrium_andersonii.AAC.1
MALHSCAVTPLPTGLLRKLVSKCATVMDPRAARFRSPQVALALAHPRNLDPRAYVLVQRVLALRRAWYVLPMLQHRLQHALQWQADAGSGIMHGAEASHDQAEQGVSDAVQARYVCKRGCT